MISCRSHPGLGGRTKILRGPTSDDIALLSFASGSSSDIITAGEGRRSCWSVSGFLSNLKLEVFVFVF